MKIKIIREGVVTQEIEKHFEVEINKKRVCVSTYLKLDEFGQEGDTEIFKGKDLLTDKEQEQVIDFINEQ
jgi:hypothetical protein